jgi:hypothetical protein
MKKLYNIFLFAAVVCASTLVSCAKDDTLNPTPEYTKVEMTITRAASTTEQGDKIEDVTVWAYELNGSGANATIGNNGKPGLHSCNGTVRLVRAVVVIVEDLPPVFTPVNLLQSDIGCLSHFQSSPFICFSVDLL